MVRLIPYFDMRPGGRDSVADAACLMGWLSIAFGISLLLGGAESALAILRQAAPAWAWVILFWVLGTVTLVSTVLGTYTHRFWLGLIETASWLLVTAVYWMHADSTGFVRPSGLFAFVLAVYSGFTALKLWVWVYHYGKQ